MALRRMALRCILFRPGLGPACSCYLPSEKSDPELQPGARSVDRSALCPYKTTPGRRLATKITPAQGVRLVQAWVRFGCRASYNKSGCGGTQPSQIAVPCGSVGPVTKRHYQELNSLACWHFPRTGALKAGTSIVKLSSRTPADVLVKKPYHLYQPQMPNEDRSRLCWGS